VDITNVDYHRCDQPHPLRSSAPITQPHPPKRPFGVLSCAPDPLHTDLLRNAIGSHHDAATLHIGINRFVRVAVCMLGPNWHSTEETYTSNARPHQFDLTPQCTTPQHHDYTRSLPNYCQPRVKESCNPQTMLTKSKFYVSDDAFVAKFVTVRSCHGEKYIE
jgi:hypothetical protein